MSHAIASVLKSDPDWTALPANTPAGIRRLLRRCLEKDRKRRLTDADAARLEIDEALGPPSFEGAVTAAASSPSRVRLAWIVAAVAAACGCRAPGSRAAGSAPDAATRAARDARRPRHAAHRRPRVVCALARRPANRLSRRTGDGASRLWLRSLATTAWQPLAGTEGATFPFWAPDSRSVGFFAAGALKRLDLGGGGPQTLAPAINGRGGMWNTDGVILVAPGSLAP